MSRTDKDMDSFDNNLNLTRGNGSILVTDMNLSAYLDYYGIGDMMYLHSEPTGLHDAMLVLCGCAFASNIVSIAATINVPRSQGVTTHLKLIISLAVSDLLVAVSVILYTLDKMREGLFKNQGHVVSVCIKEVIVCFNSFAFLVTLMNLIAMALDHYLFVLKPLHYDKLVSKKRGNRIIAALWTTAIIVVVLDFIFASFQYPHYDGMDTFCKYVQYDQYELDRGVVVLTAVALLTMGFIYLRIYMEVRRIRNRTLEIQRDSLHNNKAMTTTLLILGIFTLCWLPNCIYQIVMVITVYRDVSFIMDNYLLFSHITEYLFLFQVFNSLCDPIIYAVRLRIVQSGYKAMVKHIYHFFQKHSSAVTFPRDRRFLDSTRYSTRRTTRISLADDDEAVCSQASADMHDIKEESLSMSLTGSITRNKEENIELNIENEFSEHINRLK